MKNNGGFVMKFVHRNEIKKSRNMIKDEFPHK